MKDVTKEGIQLPEIGLTEAIHNVVYFVFCSIFALAATKTTAAGGNSGEDFLFRLIGIRLIFLCLFDINSGALFSRFSLASSYIIHQQLCALWIMSL